MKQFIYVTIVALLATIGFVSCTADDMISSEPEMHTFTMHLNASREEYDGLTTRSATQWQEGDSIYLLFTTASGTVPGMAYYRSTSQDWQVNFYGTLTSNTPSQVTVYYFEKPQSLSTSDVKLSPTTAIYYDSYGTYTFSNKDLSVTTTLRPLLGRIRFKGTAGTAFSLHGLTIYKNYIIRNATLNTSTDTIVTTIQADGYSPYIYGYFTDTNNPTLVIEYNAKYTASCGSNILKTGKSGWMNLPTKDNHNGWEMQKYPVTGITLDKTLATLNLNDTLALQVTVTPANATEKGVTWTSSDSNIATVSNTGVVTAKAYGTTTITATSQDNPQAKATCVVNVPLTITVNGVSFTMILVEAGSFTMGATSEQVNPEDNEKPTHQVTLTKNYYMSQTEVTQALWKAVTGSSKSWSSTYGVGDNYPAYYVTWNECQTFISQLNQLTGKTFRLPTEAEWEFAARGGNKSKHTQYSGSATIDDVAWYTSNSSSTTHTVATKAPNELGIYDMSGNVWEWCQDWYGSYSSSTQTDPTGPTSGSNRVCRGGSWGGYATCCRTAYRGISTPSGSNNYLGLRLVLSE